MKNPTYLNMSSTANLIMETQTVSFLFTHMHTHKPSLIYKHLLLIQQGKS